MDSHDITRKLKEDLQILTDLIELYEEESETLERLAAKRDEAFAELDKDYEEAKEMIENAESMSRR